MITKNKYIQNLIEQGEHQQLDFKFEISDAKKIAKTLVAFANTDGGILLIGVKDNGNIAGIKSEEELYMVDAAARLYSKPEVKFKFKQWRIDSKTILEININKSVEKPHFAQNEIGKWLVYIRVKDQNLLANHTLLQIWKREKSNTGIQLNYGTVEHCLLNYLLENSSITLKKFSEIANIPRYKAEKVLINFILLNTIEMIIEENQTFFRLKDSKTI